MSALRSPTIVQDQCAASSRFREVAVHLAMAVHRAGHITAAMQAEENPVLSGLLGGGPHRRDATSIHFDVIHSAWLAGQRGACVDDPLGSRAWARILTGDRQRSC